MTVTATVTDSEWPGVARRRAGPGRRIRRGRPWAAGRPGPSDRAQWVKLERDSLKCQWILRLRAATRRGGRGPSVLRVSTVTYSGSVSNADLLQIADK